MINLNQYKVELTYPCNWKYKIIIKAEYDINTIIRSILKDREYEILKSNSSSKGKFNSFSLNLKVINEEDRVNLYKYLQNHQKIKMIV
jgi:putative lipoic acid-binding regulatory protein